MPFCNVLSVRILLLSALVTSLPLAAAAIPVTADLEGYWPGEGNANDLSGNANHGTELGGLAYAPGRVGQSFLLDGVNDLVDIPSSSTLDATGPFTIAAWVKRASTGSYHTIVDRGLGLSDPQSSYTLRLEKSNVAWFEWEDTGSNVGVSSATTITDNAWHHVAGVFDGTNSIIYVDGAVETGISTALTPTVNESGVQIGARRTGPVVFDLFFEGQIDEVAFYSRALTPAEIELLAADGGTPAVPAMGPLALALLSGLLLLGAAAVGWRGRHRTFTP